MQRTANSTQFKKKESPVSSKESQTQTRSRKRKCTLPKISDIYDEIEIIALHDSSDEDIKHSNNKSSKNKILTKTSKSTNKRNATKSKPQPLNKRLRSLSIDLLTPNGVSNYSSRFSPLPNFDFAEAREVWDHMIHSENVYQRNALMLHRHPSLQARMRSILIDWLSEVCEVYRLNRDTYYLSVDFIDRYLSYQTDVPKQQLQLIGITCLFIAAKVEEIYPPKMSEFAYVTDGACNELEITSKEIFILKALNWNLYPMTINSWLTLYMQIYASLEKENDVLERDGDSFLIPDYQSNLFAQIAHLVDLCILDIGSLTYSYSLIAASALYHFTNEDTVYQCTGIRMNEIRDCVVWMIPFALAIKDEGFDNPKLQQKFDKDSQSLLSIQCHTVDLQLLEKAYIKRCEQESEDSVSPISSPVASRVAVLTPPKSSSKKP